MIESFFEKFYSDSDNSYDDIEEAFEGAEDTKWETLNEFWNTSVINNIEISVKIFLFSSSLITISALSSS